MYVKAVLFFVMGALCVAGILVELPSWRIGLCLALGIWSFCRLYYFAFYVIEHYIDAEYKFAGLRSVVVYLWQKRRTRGKV